MIESNKLLEAKKKRLVHRKESRLSNTFHFSAVISGSILRLVQPLRQTVMASE
jgi:hypothetical protein